MKIKHFLRFRAKDKVLKAELARAHAMIVLLVIALMFILMMSSTFNVILDPLLVFLVVVMLAIVGMISLAVVVSTLRKK